MNEVLCSDIEYISINGKSVSVNIVKSIFMKVDGNHIQYVIGVINQYDKKIKNMKGFIISTLYNSVITLDAYYANLVQINNN